MLNIVCNIEEHELFLPCMVTNINVDFKRSGMLSWLETMDGSENAV
jgi:hypothetical protein